MEYLRRLLQKVNSPLLGSLAIGLQRLVSRISGKVPSGRSRLLVANLQPVNPLAGHTSLPEIELLVPFVEKDVWLVESVVIAACAASANPIGSVKLVTPHPDSTVVAELLASLTSSLQATANEGLPVIVEGDKQVLGPELTQLFRRNPQLRGWHAQQLVKFGAVLKSDYQATLVLDADTILLKQRVFLAANGVQILPIGQSYRRQYEAQFEGYFASRKKTPMMFITHHQLMQKDVVHKMFPRPSSLLDWVRFSLLSDHFWISEYDSYGSFLERHFPRRVRYASWGNTKGFVGPESASDGGLEELVASLRPHHHSVSFHSDNR